MCKIADCSKPIFRRQWCAGHYHRWRRYGSPVASPFDGPAPTYPAVHARVTAAYGPAVEHLCCWCHGPASQWAYDHCDSDHLHDQQRGPWSTSKDHYIPLCLRCHRDFDDKARLTKAARNQEIIERSEAGESLSSIARDLGISRQRAHQIARSA